MRGTLWRSVAAAAAVWAGSAAPCAAQRTTQVSVAAGTGTDERGVTSSSVTVAPAAVLPLGSHLSVSLGAAATRFETAAWTAGGSVTVAARSSEVAGAALSLNTGGGASRSSFGTTFTVAEATPAVEWSAWRVTLFGGGRAAFARTEVRSAPQAPLSAAPGAPLQAVARTSAGPVFGARVRVLGDAWASPLVATYREEHGRVNGVVAVDRSAGVTVSTGALSVSGAAGWRVAPGDDRRYATASASFALAPSASIDVAGGRYPPDRLTGVPEGRFLAAGLTFRFGSRGPSLPEPRGVPAPARGFTRLSIRAPEARRVDLYGDWNDWTPVAARFAANGVWYADVPLRPGEYRYAFRVDEVEWRVPEQAVSAADGFGGRSAYVVVADTGNRKGSDSREEQ